MLTERLGNGIGEGLDFNDFDDDANRKIPSIPNDQNYFIVLRDARSTEL